MSKRARVKAQRREDYENILINKFSLTSVKPATDNQRKVFEIYGTNSIVGIFGTAGTGKTYLAAYLALSDAIANENFDRIVYVRSSVQSRDQGHMPGDEKEKMSYFEQPIIEIVNELLENAEAYSVLKRAKKIEYMSTSFCRGLTKDNCIIIFDECQNANYDELRTVLTRLGKNSKIIFCGDTMQDDLKNNKNKMDVSGLKKLTEIFELCSSAAYVEMGIADIQRSGVIKDFLIAEEEHAKCQSPINQQTLLKG